MKIEFPTTDEDSYADLNIGDVFIYAREAFIVTNSVASIGGDGRESVSLVTGHWRTMEGTAKVKVMPDTIVILDAEDR